jgi:hypothetical protein
LEAKAHLSSPALKLSNRVETVGGSENDVGGNQGSGAEHLAALTGKGKDQSTDGRVLALGDRLAADDGLNGRHVGLDAWIVEVLRAACGEESNEAHEGCGGGERAYYLHEVSSVGGYLSDDLKSSFCAKK